VSDDAPTDLERPEAAPDDPASPGPGDAEVDDRYRVHVGTFEGPLDLLLHLVRVNEVDITDIPILEITRQYHDHLEMMRELDLEVAGEYVVMASTLMHIKSRMLLPADPDAAGEDGAEDPRAELVQQLLEYQKYKQAAENLSAMDSRRTLIWTREGEVPEEFRGEELLAVDLTDLIVSFRKMLGRLDEEARLRFKQDNVSVAEKIQWLGDLLQERRTLALLPLIESLPTRLDRIATFLAMLEMMRLRLIAAFQRGIAGEIRIVLRDDIEEAPPAAQEPDEDEPEPTPGPPIDDDDDEDEDEGDDRIPTEDGDWTP